MTRSRPPSSVSYSNRHERNEMGLRVRAANGIVQRARDRGVIVTHYRRRRAFVAASHAARGQVALIGAIEPSASAPTKRPGLSRTSIERRSTRVINDFCRRLREIRAAITRSPRVRFSDRPTRDKASEKNLCSK